MFRTFSSKYTYDSVQSSFFIEQGNKILSELYLAVPAISVSSSSTSNIFSGLLSKAIMAKVLGDKIDMPPDLDSVEYERMEYLVGIASVIWALYANTKETTGIYLERGSFTVIDPENKLYNFLLNYVAFANKIPISALKELSYKTANSYAYPRISSHYKGCSQQQYGIDMRFFVTAKKLLTILPNGFSHILFSSLNFNHIFIKCETVGLGNKKEFFVHAINFCKFCIAPKRKISDNCYRETDLPVDLLQTYIRFCQAIGKPVSKKQKLKIYEMWDIIQTSGILSTDTAIKMQRDFVQQVLAHKMNLATLKIRVGKEVILSLKSIISGGGSMISDESFYDSLSSGNQQYTLSVNHNDEQYMYSPEGVLPRVDEYRKKFEYMATVNCAQNQLDERMIEQFKKDARRQNFYLDTRNGILIVHNFDPSGLLRVFEDNYLDSVTKEAFTNFWLQTCHQVGFVNMAEDYFTRKFGDNNFIIVADRKPLYVDLTSTGNSVPIIKIIEEFDIVNYTEVSPTGMGGHEYVSGSYPAIAKVQFESEVNCTKETNKFTPKRLLIKVIDPELAKNLFSGWISGDKKISAKPETDVPSGLKSVELEQKITDAEAMHIRSLQPELQGNAQSKQQSDIYPKSQGDIPLEQLSSLYPEQQPNKYSFINKALNVALKVLFALTVIGAIVMLAMYLWRQKNTSTADIPPEVVPPSNGSGSSAEEKLATAALGVLGSSVTQFFSQQGRNIGTVVTGCNTSSSEGRNIDPVVIDRCNTSSSGRVSSSLPPSPRNRR